MKGPSFWWDLMDVTRMEGLERLKQELTVHEAIEEEILYPALIGFAKT